jgi:hypothetical protein
MKNFRAADKSHAGGDEKHDINFHWPYHISSFEYSLQAFCINIRTFKCQRKLRERK